MNYSKQDCIRELRSAAEELGHPPTSAEWKEGRWNPSAKTIADKFGSWNKGKEAANLEIFEQGVTKQGVNQRYGADACIYVTQQGYERVTAIGEYFYLHRLLAVAEYGFDEVARKCVHHKNEIEWDNRPENISLMSRDEHQSHHIDKT